MAVFERIFTQDLTKPVAMHLSEGCVFSADNDSTIVGVKLYDNGAEAAVTGNVVAYAIRSDNNTVVFSGTISNGVVKATLPQSCFAYVGPLAIMLQVVSGDVKTTVLKAVFRVVASSTGSPIDPGSVIPDIADIIAMLDDLEEAIADAEGATDYIAPTETSPAESAHTAPEFIIYDGALYEVTSPIAVGDTLTVGTNIKACPYGFSGVVADIKTVTDDLLSYNPVASGNSIDVTGYEGESRKVTSVISVGTATATFELYCCGKNHVKLTADSGGVNGFTWVSSTDGTITLNGTTDRNYLIQIKDVLCVYNTKWRASIQKSAQNSSVQLYFNGQDKGDSFEFGTHTTAYAKQIYLHIPSGTTCDNLVVRPMVEFGDYPVSISYEAFKGFALSHTFGSAVTSGTIDWGKVTIPEDATTLWMYDSGNISTIYDKIQISDRLDDMDTEIASMNGDIEAAYSHAYAVDVNGWTDSAVTYESGYINSNGAVISNPSFRYSNYIPCVAGDLIAYNLYGYSSSVYIVTFYNSAKTRISGIVGMTGYTVGTVTAPENAAYVVFSTSSSYLGTFTVSVLARVSGDDLADDLRDEIAANATYDRSGIAITRANARVITGSIYTNQGLWNLESGRRTDYIPVSEGDTISYRCYAYIGTSLKTNTITTFDANKIPVGQVRAEETGVISGTYTVPSGVAYVMLSWSWAMQYDGWFNISEAEYSQSLKDYLADNALAEASPLNGKQWCCLGDSITYGANTTKTYFNFIEERCAVTPWNFGESNTAIAKKTDATTNAMVQRYTSMYDDVDYVTVFGGTNDHGQNIPIGEWGDTALTTLYGAMKTLVEGLVAKYVGKKIGFILPLPKYSTTSGGVSTNYSYPSESFYPYIQCIEDVCKRYSIPVLNLYLESCLAVGNADVRTALIPDGLHPNANGHEYISRKIQSFLERL